MAEAPSFLERLKTWARRPEIDLVAFALGA